jgi:hypothetical protein
MVCVVLEADSPQDVSLARLPASLEKTPAENLALPSGVSSLSRRVSADKWETILNLSS